MGTPGYAEAVRYLLREAGKVKDLAANRSDLAVEARPLLGRSARRAARSSIAMGRPSLSRLRARAGSAARAPARTHLHRAAAAGAAARAAQQALRARPALRVGLYPTLLRHTLQVELETVSGAMDMHFLNADLTNAYAELDNVVLALVPAAGAAAPGLLLGAHFDATLDTPGAGLGRRRRAHGLRAQRSLRSTRMAQCRMAPAAWSAGCPAVSGKQQCDHAVEGTWRRQHARASLRAASGRQQGCRQAGA